MADDDPGDGRLAAPVEDEARLREDQPPVRGAVGRSLQQNRIPIPGLMPDRDVGRLDPLRITPDIEPLPAWNRILQLCIHPTPPASSGPHRQGHTGQRDHDGHQGDHIAVPLSPGPAAGRLSGRAASLRLGQRKHELLKPVSTT